MAGSWQCTHNGGMSGEKHHELALNRQGSESTKARDVTREGKKRAKHVSRLQWAKRPEKEQKGQLWPTCRAPQLILPASKKPFKRAPFQITGSTQAQLSALQGKLLLPLTQLPKQGGNKTTKQNDAQRAKSKDYSTLIGCSEPCHRHCTVHSSCPMSLQDQWKAGKDTVRDRPEIAEVTGWLFCDIKI